MKFDRIKVKFMLLLKLINEILTEFEFYWNNLVVFKGEYYNQLEISWNMLEEIAPC